MDDVERLRDVAKYFTKENPEPLSAVTRAGNVVLLHCTADTLARLPVTADGVRVVPGKQAFYYFTTPPSLCEITVASVGIAGDAICDWTDGGEPAGDVLECSKLWSSREAWEAAQKGK